MNYTDLFVIAKNDETGKLAYCDKGLSAEDVLTAYAMFTKYTYEIGVTEIGLTDEEVKDNIDTALKEGIKDAIKTLGTKQE